MEEQARPAFGDAMDKENQPNLLPRKTPSKTPAKTPSKDRVSLGAPANFYFKYMNSSTKKSKPNDNTATATSFLGAFDDDEDVTGLISIPALAKATDQSMAEADKSTISIDTSSSSEADWLNKSTLSDTTDLTASSFVLQATSRHIMRQLGAQSAKKRAKVDAFLQSTSAAPSQESSASATKPPQPAESSTAEPVVEEVDVLTQRSAAMAESPLVLTQQTTPKTKNDTKSRRRSMHGASPSIRTRMSATPQSLQKLTEDLKSQRMKSQAKEQDSAMRRLSMDSKNSMLSLNLDLDSILQTNDGDNKTPSTGRKRLPPSFEAPVSSVKANQSMETENVTNEIMGMMQEVFAPTSQETTETVGKETPQSKPTAPESSESLPPSVESPVSSVKANQSMETENITNEIMGMMQEVFAPTSQETTETVAKETPQSKPTTPQTSDTASPTDIIKELTQSQAPTSEEEKEAKQDSPVNDIQTTPPSTPTRESKSYLEVRLTPGPTPTKLEATPRRIVNPRALDSPARNTRSASKSDRKETLGGDETASLGDLNGILGGMEAASPMDVDESREAHLAEDAYAKTIEEETTPAVATTDEVAPSVTETKTVVEAEQVETETPPAATTDGATSSALKPTDVPNILKMIDSPEESVHDAKNEAQEEGDTVSVNNISAILSGTQPIDSPFSATFNEASIIQQSETELVATQRSSQTKTPQQEAGDLSQHSFGSAESSSSPPPGRSDGSDTASIGDIADILGIGSSQLTSNSPGESSQASPASQYSRISTQVSQNSESKIQASQTSIGSADKTESKTANGQETATLEDIADILGSSQTSRASPATRPSSIPEESQPESMDSPSDKGNDEVTPTSPPAKGVEESHAPQTPPGPKAFEPSILTPRSQTKLTPSKLNQSPRRVLNPRRLDSPARNTRSGRKSLGDAHSVPGLNFAPASETKESVTADTEPGVHIFQDETATTKERTLPPSNSKPVVRLETLSTEVEVAVSRNKRRRSSLPPTPSLPAMDKENGSSSPKSPTSKKKQPVSILSSVKRQKTKSAIKTPRSVAFGSPEAAEYHVGSPSVSMTPMLPSRAKQMFSIPRTNTSGENSSIAHGGGEHTVEIEADLNILIDNMKDSPALSPISNVKEHTGIVILPGNYSLTKSKEKQPAESTSKHSIQSESTTSSPNPEEHTVQLEGGMEGLLANLKASDVHSPISEKGSILSEGKSGISMESNDAMSISMEDNKDTSPNTSVDMTDAQSIASLNSAKSINKFTSKLELGAQKLDFSFKGRMASPTNESSDSMDIDEGDTVELEQGMTVLLAASGVQASIAALSSRSQAENELSAVTTESPNPSLADKHTHTVALEDGMTALISSTKMPTAQPSAAEDIEGGASESICFDQSPVSTKSRRSSLASRRFSLVADDKLEFLPDGSIRDRDVRPSDDRSVSFASTNLDKSVEVPEVSIGFEDILTVGGLTRTMLRPHGAAIEGDALNSFHSSALKQGSAAVEKWNNFLDAVCGEVEKQTEDEEAAPSALSEFFSEEPARFVGLQKTIESGDGDATKAALDSLVVEGRKAIDSEWRTWLTTVMESFQNPLNELAKDLSEQTANAEKCLNGYSEVETKIGQIQSQRSRRARRKSLGRRQARATSLEDEVELMKKLVAETSAALETASKEQKKSAEELASFSALQETKDEEVALRPEVRSSQRNISSLKGLHSWVPVAMDDSVVEVSYNGSSLHTCTTIRCAFAKDGTINTVIQKQDGVSEATRRSLNRYGASITNFVRNNVEQINDSFRNKEQVIDASMHIQDYMCAMGRLDQTAAELQSLLRRYKGKLSSKESTASVFAVDFQGSSSKLTAEFEVPASYPATSLEVKMDVWEGQVDFDGIRRALVKNVQAGHGSLSRSCDVIDSYIK